MRVRFWGVRGSVPWATPMAIGHGCNTPCLEVHDERTGATLILDAGSGIVGAGLALTGEPRDISIVLTHYHWDHLQGLPFIGQLYAPGWSPHIFAPAFEHHDPAWVGTIFQSPFFPIPYHCLPNPPSVQIIEAGHLQIGGFELSAVELNHPGGALAFRVRGTTGDLVYATDHEFGRPEVDEPLADFVRGAAALVIDSHFTPEELPRYAGWGHSDWRQCATFAAANNVGQLFLFHHKPGRTDEELVAIRLDAQRVFAATDTSSEGTVLQL
jgi:phosphoribosyl 1,2-cyclic phosphodiesterase